MLGPGKEVRIQELDLGKSIVCPNGDAACDAHLYGAGK
jgi:hypothetical protein